MEGASSPVKRPPQSMFPDGFLSDIFAQTRSPGVNSDGIGRVYCNWWLKPLN